MPRTTAGKRPPHNPAPPRGRSQREGGHAAGGELVRSECAAESVVGRPLPGLGQAAQVRVVAFVPERAQLADAGEALACGGAGLGSGGEGGCCGEGETGEGEGEEGWDVHFWGIGDDWVRGVVRGVCGNAGGDVEEGGTVRGVGTRNICRRLQSTSRQESKYVPTC